MNTFDPFRRQDEVTALVVNAGVIIKAELGCAAVLRYLRDEDIPDEVVRRVFLEQGPRRPTAREKLSNDPAGRALLMPISARSRRGQLAS